MKFDRLKRARQLVESRGRCGHGTRKECQKCPFGVPMGCVITNAYERAKKYIEKFEVIDYVLQEEEK